MPVNSRQNIEEVRFLSGDWQEPFTVPDSMINSRLCQYADKEEPVAVWCAAIDVVKAMIALFARDGARRRERRGSEEIELYGNELVGATQQTLKQLLRRPPRGVSQVGVIKIGGTSREEYDRVACDPDSLAYGPRSDWFDRQDVEVGLNNTGYSDVTS